MFEPNHSSECSATTRVWDLHGVTVRIDSELSLPPEFTHAFRRREVEVRGDAADPSVRLRIVAGDFPDTATLEGRSVELERPMPVTGCLAFGRYTLRAGRGGIYGDVETGDVTVWAPSETWLGDATVVRTLVPVALLMHLARAGMFFAHAAAVVDPRGEGWLILGPGGGGKSTTAYALVRRGWSVVSDDGVLLRMADDGVEALAFMDGFHLAYEQRKLFPELRFIEGLRDHPSKGIVDLDRIYPNQCVDQCRPSRIVGLLVSTRPKPGDGSITGVHWVLSMAEENPFVYLVETGSHLEVLTTLVGACRRGHLEVGETIVRDPEAALRSAVNSLECSD
ncbi:MAG: hypothetical protein V3T05_11385 [Myxococcota bacterium]